MYKMKVKNFEEGQKIPYLGRTGEQYFTPLFEEETFEAFGPDDLGLDPDAWDDDEYNIGLMLRGVPVRVHGYDFEDVDEEEEEEKQEEANEGEELCTYEIVCREVQNVVYRVKARSVQEALEDVNGWTCVDSENDGEDEVLSVVKHT